ncbi:MAG TPA: hypothetical protein PL048_01650 [Leptospiraceae bacterium]|nr:hypothetical protein [Leptospiraceae bacterium]
MNDTSPEIEQMLHERHMKMTGEERVMIAASMYDTAREIVLSSLPPNLTEKEKRVQLFLRFYGNEFSDEGREKIVNHLMKVD